MKKEEIRTHVSSILQKRMKQQEMCYSDLIEETRLDMSVIYNAVNYGTAEVSEFIAICNALEISPLYVIDHAICESRIENNQTDEK